MSYLGIGGKVKDGKPFPFEPLTGVEPASNAWQALIIAVIPQRQVADIPAEPIGPTRGEGTTARIP